MDVFRTDVAERPFPRPDGNAAMRSLDPRLRPTPDYGTLEPGCDLAKSHALPSPALTLPIPAAAGASGPGRRPRVNLRLLHLAAMMVGIGFAWLVSSGGGRVAVWEKITGLFSPQTISPVSSTLFSERDLDRQRPQKQAEILLERAVSYSDGAANQSKAQIGAQTGAQIGAQTEAQIEARIAAWRGKLKWDSQLGGLATVALNSKDPSVRASAIEVQLAAYGLAKTDSSVDALAKQANSSDHARKIWALWTLGLLGNRGVETDRVVQLLTAHLKDSGKDSGKDKD
jgi:hypothetical protein